MPSGGELRLLSLPLLAHMYTALLPSFLLATLLMVPAPAMATAPGASGLCPPSACKAVPGTPGWPTLSVWAQLNDSTSGRLFQPTPPGAVCHPGQPTYNTAECTVVQAAWSTQTFHDSNPVSSMYQQWNNDTCLPNATDPCSGEGYPVYVLNATTAEHVKAAIDFGK